MDKGRAMEEPLRSGSWFSMVYSLAKWGYMRSGEEEKRRRVWLENLNGVRPAVGVSNTLVPLAIAEELMLGFVLGAFISALDEGQGGPQAAAGHQASIYITGLGYREGRTGVQRGLEKCIDGSLLILEWVKVQILQLGRKEKPHIKLGK